MEQIMEPCLKTVREVHTAYSAEYMVLREACKHVIHHVCRDVIIWEAIEADVIELKRSKDSLDAEIQLSKRLPQRYEKALEQLIRLMDQVWGYAVEGFYRVLISSPHFIEYFEIVQDQDEAKVYTSFRLKKSKTKNRPQILKLLLHLSDPTTANMMGAFNILDEMERVANSDSGQRAMINAGMAREIARLAAFAQIRDGLVRHQPTFQVTQDYESIIKYHKARLEPIDVLEEKLLPRIPLVACIKPLSAFKYPAEKKRTLQHVEQMRRAEGKLDAFWVQVDTGLKHHTGKTLQEWLGKRLTSRQIERTQPWQPDREQQSQKPSYLPLPEIYRLNSPPAPETTQKLPTEPRKKQKTRGEIDSSREPSTTEAATTPQDMGPPTQTFSIPDRVLLTMNTLYPTSIEDRKRKTIVWRDFLTAMYELGFEIQKRHGSEWYCTCS